jgi:hypothetical protein
MTHRRNSVTTDAAAHPFGKRLTDPIPRQPDVSTDPIFHNGLPCVRAVYTALSGHLRRPPRVLDLGRAEGPRPLDSPPCPVPPRYEDIDLVLCTDAKARTGEALLDAMSGAAHAVGAVLFESVLDYWTAGRHDEPSDAFVRLRREFAFVHTIGEHDAGGERRAVMFCSNRYWYVDGRLDAFDSWTPHSSEITGRPRQGSRRYFFGTDTVAKTYCFCGSSAWDNHPDMVREVSFLSNPPIQDTSIPRLVAHRFGNRDGALVMERLPGILLTTAVLRAIDYDPAPVLRAVLERLCALERVGLYHNDVAQWNVLVDGDRGPVLIDFASITDNLRSGHWPYDPILHFFLFAQTVIQRRFLSSPMGVFPIVPFDFPQPYRRWAALVWSRPRNRRSFALLKDCFEDALDDEVSRPKRAGISGRLTRRVRRIGYCRTLVSLQLEFFIRRLRIVTTAGIVRYLRARTGRLSAPQPIGSPLPPGVRAFELNGP